MHIVWVSHSEWTEIKKAPANYRRGLMFLPIALRDAMTKPDKLNLIYGSRHSAKTETWCRYKLWQIRQPEYCRIMFARRTKVQARGSMRHAFAANSATYVWYTYIPSNSAPICVCIYIP